jgi:type IV pilus assembly protein PilW
LSASPLATGIEYFRVEVGIDSVSETGAATNYAAGVTWADPTVWDTPTNRGDGVHDGGYIHCGVGCTAAQLTDVVTTRVHIIARADEPSSGYIDSKTFQLGNLNVAAANDSFKRHAFSDTILLRTVSGRRETPP